MSIKKILNTKWIIIIFLLALFPPEYFDQNATVKLLLNVLKATVSVAVMLLYITNIRTHLKKAYNIILLILWAELLISTLISDDASMYFYTTQVIDTLIPCFLVGIMAMQSPINGIKAMYYYFSMCAIANTISFILFPGAMYAQESTGNWVCWFLGGDNTGYSYYIVASTLAMIYCSNIAGRVTLTSVLVWISGFIFAFGREIGSGMICQTIWAILFVIYSFRKFRQFIKARYIFYITAAGFLGIVIFRNLIFESIAVAVGKDITLTGRTWLWDKVIKAVMEKPAFGYGLVEGEIFKRVISTGVTGAHNQVLMLMFWGGLIAVFIFALLLGGAIKDAGKARKTSFYRCAVIGTVVISIRLFVENGYSNHLYLILTMLAYAREFSQRLEPAALNETTHFQLSADRQIKQY